MKELACGIDDVDIVLTEGVCTSNAKVEIDEETAGRLFKLAVKVAKNMKEALGLEAMNLVQNNGSMAGQTVHHFHLHLIPRYKDDKVQVKWEQTRFD